MAAMWGVRRRSVAVGQRARSARRSRSETRQAAARRQQPTKTDQSGVWRKGPTANSQIAPSAASMRLRLIFIVGARSAARSLSARCGLAEASRTLLSHVQGHRGARPRQHGASSPPSRLIRRQLAAHPRLKSPPLVFRLFMPSWPCVASDPLRCSRPILPLPQCPELQCKRVALF